MNKFALVAGMLMLVACGDNKGSIPDGDACEMDNECESGLCVTEFDDGVAVAGGMCTTVCEWDSDGSGGDNCAEAEVCLHYSATEEYYCFMLCGADEDCRTDEDWSCEQIGFGISACIPPFPAGKPGQEFFLSNQ